MNSQKRSLKTFFITFAVVLVLGMAGSLLLKEYKQKKYPEKFSEKSIAVKYNPFPQIVNMPPRSVFINSEFRFNPRIVPSGEDVKLTLLNGPDWLSFENDVVFGNPLEKGSFSFILRIEKEGEYVDREFYLVVKEEIDE